MLLRHIPCTLWLLVAASPLASGQKVVPLADDPDYQEGLRALGHELPELAATRFEEALNGRKDDDPDLTELRLRLVEALVRDSRRDGQLYQLEKALPLFDLPDLVDNETALFWKAQAIISLGHFFDAATTLGQLADAEDPGLRRLAALTRARLLASLGDTREAILLLTELTDDNDPDTAAEAKLLRASLHLEAGEFDAASDLLAETESEPLSLQKQKQYLEARLTLGRRDWTTASTLFRNLTENPRHLPRQLFHGSVLGHADALAELGQKDDAVSFLLAFLEDHPDTNFLAPFFSRLIPWSADNDTRQELLQDRLLAWSKAPVPTGDPIATTLAEVSEVFDTRPSSLNTFSLYHRALHLALKNDAESLSDARLLLARLRLENPNHPLALASLLETGNLHIGDKNPALALASIEALEELAGPGPLRAEAAELAALIRFANGDYAEAAEAFSLARQNFQDDNRILATINQGLSLLMSGKPTGFTELLNSLEDQEAVLALTLERALLQAANNDPKSKEFLDAFLRNHPAHPRSAEARLAVARLSVTLEPLDLAMALAQLNSVDPTRPEHSPEIALRHLLIRLKLGELTGEWDDAIAEAITYLKTHKEPEEEVLLKLGEAFYLNGDYNKAYMQFLQVANREDENPGPHREVALFFAAMSALRIGTDTARADGLKQLRQVTAQNGPLAGEARLQMGRAYIDLGEHEKALAELTPLLAPEEQSRIKIDAQLLAAEAHRALGGTSHLTECLAIYDKLLADPELPYALNNQIHFNKGVTFELQRQPGLALETYYRVINKENLSAGEPITEWKWFYKCGFSALLLLEESKRWRSAYNVAILLKEAGGYRSKDAEDRAEWLQLEHQIWDDKPSAPPGN